MFSLIITIIAIALVAALALATLYYGGPIFNEGADRAQAAKIEAQGQQIMGAMELYHAEKGVYPAALADLVTDEYLRSIPTAAAEQAQLVASALAATGTWSLASPGQPVIVMKPVSLATCKAFNLSNIGVAGVLQQAHSTKLKQCVGTDVNNLMIVQPKAVADLLYVAADATAAVQIGSVLSTPVPVLTDTTANGFLDTAVSAPTGYSVSYSLPSLTFPDVSVNSSSAPQTVTVTNTGTGALTITNVAVPAPFVVSNTTCLEMAPAATCAVTVTFSPTAAQSYSGASYALTLQASPATLTTLPLVGTGVASGGGGGSGSGSGQITFSGLTHYASSNNTVALENIATDPLDVYYEVDAMSYLSFPHFNFDAPTWESLREFQPRLMVTNTGLDSITLLSAESYPDEDPLRFLALRLNGIHDVWALRWDGTAWALDYDLPDFGTTCTGPIAPGASCTLSFGMHQDFELGMTFQTASGRFISTKVIGTSTGHNPQ